MLRILIIRGEYGKNFELGQDTVDDSFRECLGALLGRQQLVLVEVKELELRERSTASSRHKRLQTLVANTSPIEVSLL